MILWYSGCGNSLFVAESLAGQLGQGSETGQSVGDTLLSVTQAARDHISLSFRTDSVLGIVFPVYAWSVPNLVLDFLRQVQMDGRPQYVYAVCTCGDNTGCTEQVLRRTLRKRGLTLHAFFTFRMPNTYINLPGFKLDSPSLAQSKIRESMDRFQETASLIRNRAAGSYFAVRGTGAFWKTYILKPLFYALLITDRKFHVNENCSSCGLCARMCPLQNISMQNGRPHWNGHCTNCNSCYHRCPHQAISFGRISCDTTGQYCFKRTE
ncbi:MAG: EFR1 family ferrodoxin [Bacteroidaceae bacterium]|nr:EFR1 family ferrodoxin [Bacteroidaceae bacterium]